MIKFEPIDDGNSWSGSDWSITNENELAKLIARVALGQSRHALKILNGTHATSLIPAKTALDGAINLLTAKDPAKPWHRDGWLFQVISWIAANLQNPKTIKSAPHMIHAHKGFDGIHLQLDSSNTNVVSVVICEEKATEGPRGKITSQVWPEFTEIESGSRDNELISELTNLLAMHGSVDSEQVVNKVLWNQARSYRVSITIGDKEHSEEGRKILFGGYEKIVKNKKVNCRRAETFYQKDLRQWMKDMADKAIFAAKEMESENV